MLTSESLWVIVDALVTSIDGLRFVFTTVGSSSPASVVACGSSLTSETSSVPCGLSPVAVAVLIILPESEADCEIV